MGHLLTDRASWRKHYKPRLDPANPVRYPNDWNQRVQAWTDPNCETVLELSVLSGNGAAGVGQESEPEVHTRA